MSTIKLSPEAFLAAAFPSEMLNTEEAILVARPQTDGDKTWYQQRAWNTRSRMLRTASAWTYCISTVIYQQPMRRRAMDLTRTWVLPCDDIGTKAVEPPVGPSYILETSPGNFQWGYFIDPVYAGDGLVDACLVGLAQAGYNDPGCRGAHRVVKLPEAVHRSGFVTVCHHWEPERSWPLAELMDLMEVEPTRMTQRRRQFTDKKIEDIVDPIYAWLTETNQALNINDRGYVEIECPWAADHTDGRSDGAGYSPLDYVTAGRHFTCFHSSCTSRSWVEFMRWVSEMGGPDIGFHSTMFQGSRT